MAERPDWVIAIRRYLVAVAIGNLLWEICQLPLYTLWDTTTRGQMAFAVIHCTGGDLIIATVALVLALVLFATPAWPNASAAPVMAAAVTGGVLYTIYSEYVNTVLRETWAYSSLMPTLPGIGTGLSPLVQWLVVPIVAMWWAARGPSK